MRLERNDGLRPWSGCHGGLTVLSCDAMQGNHDNCSYTPTSLFVALIRAYTRVHKCLLRLCFVFVAHFLSLSSGR